MLIAAEINGIVFRGTKSHLRVYKSPPLDVVLSQFNPVDVTTCFSNEHLLIWSRESFYIIQRFITAFTQVLHSTLFRLPPPSRKYTKNW
jgi:hypothetical protein